MSKVLVTGGAGFIGSYLCRKLIEAGKEVVVLDNLTKNKGEDLWGLPVELVMGDVRNIADIQKAMYEVEVVYHLAAIADITQCQNDFEKAISVNCEGTWRILTIGVKAKVKRLVFTSSAAIWGNSIYGITKRIGEGYCDIVRQAGLSTIALRLFNVYGSGSAGVIPRFIKAIEKGKDITVFGDGEQTRDFIYIEDVVWALMRAGESTRVGVMNVGTGNGTTVNQVYAQIIKGMTQDNKIGVKYESAKAEDIARSVADIQDSRWLLPEKVTSLEDGIAKMKGMNK